MYSSTTALGANWANSRLYVQLRVNNSPRFDAKSVVYCHSQTLLAANIAFGGLHRDMPEEKLDLLKLAPRIMAEACTGPPEIMRLDVECSCSRQSS